MIVFRDGCGPRQNPSDENRSAFAGASKTEFAAVTCAYLTQRPAVTRDRVERKLTAVFPPRQSCKLALASASHAVNVDAR
jgi:hypothetical protein